MIQEDAKDLMITNILFAYFIGQFFKDGDILNVSQGDYENIDNLIDDCLVSAKLGKIIKNIDMNKVESTAGAFVSYLQYNEDKVLTKEHLAFYLFLRICKNHPFNDGNKRCGFICAILQMKNLNLRALLDKKNYHNDIDPVLKEIVAQSKDVTDFEGNLYNKLEEKFFNEFLYKKISKEELIEQD